MLGNLGNMVNKWTEIEHNRFVAAELRSVHDSRLAATVTLRCHTGDISY